MRRKHQGWLSKNVLLAIAMFFPAVAMADSPPGWPEYRVCGEVRWFCADIRRVKPTLDEPGWEAQFTLRMLDRRRTLPEVLWERDYKHPGYGGGFVTTDGKYFVYVDTWYHAERPVVIIHSADMVVEVPGSAFRVKKKHLVETASHQLWLSPDNVPSRVRLDGNRLILRLIDGNERAVNLEDGTVDMIPRDPDTVSIWQRRE